MNSIASFNEDQLKTFRLICSERSAQSMTEYVLRVMERAIYALEGDPERDPSIFNDEDLRGDVIVCMSALHYLEAKSVVEGE